MVKDAEANADTDKQRRAEVEARNQAESLIHQTETTLNDLGDEVPEAEKSDIEKAMTDLKEALEEEESSAESIKSKTDILMQASMKLGEMVYRKKQEEEAANAPEEGAEGADAPEAPASDDDIVDADFTEVGEDDDSSSDDKNDDQKSA